MSENHPYRAHIPPIPDGIARPVWSVMIPTYNCAQYLRQTLLSVLAQDPGVDSMQIEVIDDCSTQDDPEAVVEEIGHGRVLFYRQAKNVGHTRNFEACLQRSQGKLIHLLHGDDCVRDGFYSKMQGAFETNPEIGAAFCRDIRMDEQGHWHSISSLLQSESGVLCDWLETIALGQLLQAPAMVVRRDVYEQLGGFDRRIRYYGEDWEMWVRIAAYYPVWYEVEPLALYRTRSASLSGRTVRTGENGRDLRRVIEINRSYLPDARAAELSKKARQNFALACLRRSHRILDAGDLQSSLAQLLEALKSSFSLRVLGQATLICLRWIEQALWPSKLRRK
jgi:glycosyltransferase involved in cell wall biosynthesis